MKVPIAACFLLMLVVGSATARDAPIVNHADIPISWSKGRPATLEEIGQAMVAGCVKRGWACSLTRPGEIRAVLNIRQHTAESRIDFDTQKYSVTYVSSSNLRYDPVKNEIHRKYNGWIDNLIGDINASIAAIP